MMQEAALIAYIICIIWPISHKLRRTNVI